MPDAETARPVVEPVMHSMTIPIPDEYLKDWTDPVGDWLASVLRGDVQPAKKRPDPKDAGDLAGFLSARYEELELWLDKVAPAQMSAKQLAGARRDLEAKRRIIGEHPHKAAETPGAGEYAIGCETCAYDGGCEGWGQYGAGWCPTLRALASPFSDEPGYLPHWKLDEGAA